MSESSHDSGKSRPRKRKVRKAAPKPPAGANAGLHHLAGSPKNADTAFRIKMRGKDGAPLSMAEVQQGLFDAMRELQPYHPGYRAKWVTLYLTLIDEDGNAVVPQKREVTLHPYKSAADEFGV